MNIAEELLLVKEYLETLTPKEKIAYKIAMTNLESSFDIMNSIGYIEYKKRKEYVSYTDI